MGWPAYVRATTSDINSEIARRTGLNQGSVSRWFKGSTPDPASVAAFAKGYRQPVLEALMAAGIVAPEDVGDDPPAAPYLSRLSNEDLLREVDRRMREGGSSAGTDEPGEKSLSGPDAGEVIELPTAAQRRRRPKLGEMSDPPDNL